MKKTGIKKKRLNPPQTEPPQPPKKRLTMKIKNIAPTCQDFGKCKRLGDQILYMLDYAETGYINILKKENKVTEEAFIKGAKEAFTMTKNFFRNIIESNRKRGGVL